MEELDKLIKEYHEQYNDIPMFLVFYYGEDAAIDILKNREGKKIIWVDDNPEALDGGNYAYV